MTVPSKRLAAARTLLRLVVARSIALSTPLRERISRSGLGKKTDRWLSAALWRLLPRRVGEHQFHVLVPPPGRGNIGDQALVEAFMDNVVGRTVLVTRSMDDFVIPQRHVGRVEVRVLPRLVYGLWPVHLVDLVRYHLLVRDADDVNVVGADIMDGKYNPAASVRRILLADHATHGNVGTRILACSWNASPDPVASQALRALSQKATVLARDPVSRQRMLDAGITLGREAADMVFAIGCSPAQTEHSCWVDAQISDGRKVVVINLSALVETQTPQVEQYAKLTAELIHDGYSVVLLPHVHRLPHSDIRLAISVAQHQDDVSRVHVVNELLAPDQILGVVAKATLVVTGRMHLAILSTTQGIPSATVATQGKVEGLYELLGLPYNVINPHDDVSACIHRALNGATNAHKTLAASLPVARTLAMANFDRLSLPKR